MKPWAVHWFRRDLRLAGNPALDYLREKYDGRVLGLFCFDSAFLARKDFSTHRFAFFLNTLHSLREEMRAEGGDLLVVDALPADFFPKLAVWAKKQKDPLAEIAHNRDYEPFARKRDEAVAELLAELGIPLHTERDHLIVEPAELEKDGPGSFYKVFTPFSKRWFSLTRTGEFADRLDAGIAGVPILKKLAAGK